MTIRCHAAAVLAAALFTAVLPAARAQSTLQLPLAGALQQGVAAAALGRCQPGLLGQAGLQAAAALGVFSPGTVSHLLPSPDEASVLAAMCGQQLHQQRCAAAIVAVAGDLMLSAYPGEQAMPPDARPNPGAVVGGVALGLAGVLLGGDSTLTRAGAGALAGYAGAKAGGAWWDRGKATACVARQRRLDAIGDQLQGAMRDASPASINALLAANLQAGRITRAEAQTLVDEANRLSARAAQVLTALR